MRGRSTSSIDLPTYRLIGDEGKEAKIAYTHCEKGIATFKFDVALIKKWYTFVLMNHLRRLDAFRRRRSSTVCMNTCLKPTPHRYDDLPILSWIRYDSWACLLIKLGCGQKTVHRSTYIYCTVFSATYMRRHRLTSCTRVGLCTVHAVSNSVRLKLCLCCLGAWVQFPVGEKFPIDHTLSSEGYKDMELASCHGNFISQLLDGVYTKDKRPGDGMNKRRYVRYCS